MRYVTMTEAKEYVELMRCKIVAKRAELGMSQRNLAKLANVSPAFVQEICAGTRSGSLLVMFRICAALGIQFEKIPAKGGTNNADT